MEIMAPEAQLILNKWYEEKRAMTCSMFSASGKAVQVAMIVGQIKSVSAEAVRVESSYGPSEVQAHTYIEIPLSHARYEYFEPEFDHGEVSELLAEAGASQLVESCLQIQATEHIAFSLVVVAEGIGPQ